MIRFEVGKRVKVIREYDHPFHTVCYKGRIGLVETALPGLARVQFSDPDLPLGYQASYFTWAQLREQEQR